MLAELAEQLIRFHLQGPDETIAHIVTTLRLAEAGITARLAAPAVDEQAERRRAADRARAKRNRERAKSAESADSSPSSSPSPHPSPNNYPNPQKQKSAAPLPGDWKPNAASAHLAGRLRLDTLGLSLEASRFSSWAAANDVRKVDWDAAFDFWLQNGAPKGFKPHGPRADGGKVIAGKFPPPASKTYFVKEGTPQWDAHVAAGHPRTMKTFKGGDAGWTFPSEWPQTREIAAGSTCTAFGN